MMSTKAKVKGSAWEAKAVEELNELIEGASFRRIPGSGAIGTTMHEPLLTSDIGGMINNFPKKFRGECKAGYNNSTGKEVKQFTVKKEWLDKVAMEAAQIYNSLPVLLCKFDNARSGVKHFIALDIRVFAELINMYTDLKNEFDEVYTELQEIKESKGGRVGTG